MHESLMMRGPKQEKKKGKERKAMCARKSAPTLFDEQTIDVEYSEVMGQSYIDYSMSTICQRAVPDIRDGLKPVQRRLIYDMQKISADSDKPHRKVSRIVGDTMGNFHPHGDASLEDALVVLAQDFKKNHKLVDGHGNFGSVEGDPHAASRYIEARLQPFAEDIFLENLRFDTVDFSPNYDELEKEPVVLPALVPNFLVNGSEGIAVGMTTNTPPHNLNEVIDGEIAYLRNPKISLDEMLETVKGPDFPTGGIVANKEDLRSIYETGEGKIRLRGKIETEDIKGGKTNLVITEIPYTMIGSGISKFLNDVAALVENRTITDITDISNQSSKEGIRIVIELKKDADVENIKNILYKKTKLEDTFGTYMLAIAEGRPETLSLLDVYRHHTAFLYETQERKYRHLLAKEQDRLEIREGLIKAVDLIDVIIAVLRGSKTQKDAKACLMTGDVSSISFKDKSFKKPASKLNFTEKQTDAILSMRLSRLIGLELDTLEKEFNESKKAIKKYEKLVSSKTVLRNDIIKTLEDIKDKYGKPRCTKIQSLAPTEIKEAKAEVTDVVILIDRFSYARVVDKAVYEKNKAAADAEHAHVIETQSDKTLFFVTDAGKFYRVPVSEIVYGRFRDKGHPIDNYVGKTYTNTERPVYFNILEDTGEKVIMASRNGFIKKMDASEITGLKRNGSLITKLDEGDDLVFFASIGNETHIALVTGGGMLLKADMSCIPEKKKSARGIIGLKLKSGDAVVKGLAFNQNISSEIEVGDTVISLNGIRTMQTGKVGKKL